jgi:transcriptional regulator with XRE-family HTH domain
LANLQKETTVSDGGPVKMFAARVRELRTGRGWSAQRLADEMTKVGIPWPRNVVVNLERNRRQSIGVDELLGLAYVFDVAPVHLLVPIDSEGQYTPVPGVNVPLRQARAWIRGQDTIGEVDVRRYASQVPVEELLTNTGCGHAAIGPQQTGGGGPICPE